MGVPFYGRTFKTTLDGNLDDETDGTAFQGPFTREDGFLGYNEICRILSNKTSGWTTMWDPETSQVLARSEKDIPSGLIQVVTFDNSRSIANKVKFSMERNLAGLMVWSIDTDDFLGECDPESDIYEDYKYLKSTNIHNPPRMNNNYPLLRTINEAITLSLEEIELQHNDKETNLLPNEEDNEIPHGSISDRKGDNSSSNHLFKNGFYIYTILLGILIFSSI